MSLPQIRKIESHTDNVIAGVCDNIDGQNSLGCESLYNCCDCGTNDQERGCGCRYCWSCNACDHCLNAD